LAFGRPGLTWSISQKPGQLTEKLKVTTVLVT